MTARWDIEQTRLGCNTHQHTQNRPGMGKVRLLEVTLTRPQYLLVCGKIRSVVG